MSKVPEEQDTRPYAVVDMYKGAVKACEDLSAGLAALPFDRTTELPGILKRDICLCLFRVWGQIKEDVGANGSDVIKQLKELGDLRDTSEDHMKDIIHEAIDVLVIIEDYCHQLGYAIRRIERVYKRYLEHFDTAPTMAEGEEAEAKPEPPPRSKRASWFSKKSKERKEPPKATHERPLDPEVREDFTKAIKLATDYIAQLKAFWTAQSKEVYSLEEPAPIPAALFSYARQWKDADEIVLAESRKIGVAIHKGYTCGFEPPISMFMVYTDRFNDALQMSDEGKAWLADNPDFGKPDFIGSPFKMRPEEEEPKEAEPKKGKGKGKETKPAESTSATAASASKKFSPAAPATKSADQPETATASKPEAASSQPKASDAEEPRIVEVTDEEASAPAETSSSAAAASTQPTKKVSFNANPVAVESDKLDAATPASAAAEAEEPAVAAEVDAALDGHKKSPKKRFGAFARKFFPKSKANKGRGREEQVGEAAAATLAQSAKGGPKPAAPAASTPAADDQKGEADASKEPASTPVAEPEPSKPAPAPAPTSAPSSPVKTFKSDSKPPTPKTPTFTESFTTEPAETLAHPADKEGVVGDRSHHDSSVPTLPPLTPGDAFHTPMGSLAPTVDTYFADAREGTEEGDKTPTANTAEGRAL